jgi:hypothetical protein
MSTVGFPPSTEARVVFSPLAETRLAEGALAPAARGVAAAGETAIAADKAAGNARRTRRVNAGRRVSLIMIV